jgi:hypothetical protein
MKYGYTISSYMYRYSMREFSEPGDAAWLIMKAETAGHLMTRRRTRRPATAERGRTAGPPRCPLSNPPPWRLFLGVPAWCRTWRQARGVQPAESVETVGGVIIRLSTAPRGCGTPR